MKLVEIKWYDSKGVTTEWEFKDEVKKMMPAVITSVGYLIDDADWYKTIVQSDTDKQFMGRLTIPQGCIKEMTVIKQ